MYVLIIRHRRPDFFFFSIFFLSRAVSNRLSGTVQTRQDSGSDVLLSFQCRVLMVHGRETLYITYKILLLKNTNPIRLSKSNYLLIKLFNTKSTANGRKIAVLLSTLLP